MDLQHPSRRRSATHLNRRTLIQRAGLASLTTGVLTATGVQFLSALDQVPVVESAAPNPPHIRTFELKAQEFDWEISTGTVVRSWGYNGQVPGPELRVQENDEVRIRLQNDLSVPTTIHWHGVNVRPAMDGVAGLSQAAVEPGAEFIYEFTAKPAGSRWYHSHTDPALQVPIGLYGSLIIDSIQPLRTYDREFTYILAEWDLELTPDVAAGRVPRGAGDRLLRGGELGSDFFVMNGRTNGMVPPMIVKEGDRILIRLINAGQLTHAFHTHGHSFTIVATDGNPVPIGSEWKKDTVLFGPGERYDLELVCDNPGVWMVHCHMEHHMANGMMTLLQYEGYQPTGPAAAAFNAAGPFSPHDHSMTSMNATPVPSPAAALPKGNSPEVEISLVDDRIVPPSLTVARGTTVSWINHGADWHTVSAFDGSFASGQLAPGQSYQHRFDRPGTYQYLCQHHVMQGMIGRLVVT